MLPNSRAPDKHALHVRAKAQGDGEHANGRPGLKLNGLAKRSGGLVPKRGDGEAKSLRGA